MREHDDYYGDDQPEDDGPEVGSPAPKVVFWHRVFCGVELAFCLLLIAGGILLISFMDDLIAADPNRGARKAEVDRVVFTAMGGVLIGMGFLMSIVYAVGMLVPQKTWGWYYGVVLICLGLGGIPSLFFCIPLLLYWLKAPTKAWFDAGSRRPSFDDEDDEDEY